MSESFHNCTFFFVNYPFKVSDALKISNIIEYD